MKQTIELFSEIMKSEFLQSPLDQEVLKQLTKEQIKSLYLLARNQDMVYFVAVALKRHKLLGQDEISNILSQNIYTTLVRHEMMVNEQECIYELFEKEKITYIPLKGAVIREYYPEPWMRTSCDIDILVKEEDLERAKECLMTSLGYTVGKYNYHDISMYSKSQVHVELHFRIVENEDNIDPLLKRVWEYASPVAPGSSRYELTPEYQIFHVFAHMYYHFIHGGCGARFVTDIWLLEKKLSYDEKTLRILCQVSGLKKFAFYVEKLAAVWFEGKRHDKVTHDMQTYIIKGGVFGNTFTKVMARKTQNNKKYLLKRIFLPYKDAIASFPKLEKYPFLYPYYTVKRWFKIFDKRTASQAVQEMKLNRGMGQKKVDWLNNLFKKLDLK